MATYKALPREHVTNYKKRWKVEELNRTTKQEIGLQECVSRSIETHSLRIFDLRKHYF